MSENTTPITDVPASAEQVSHQQHLLEIQAAAAARQKKQMDLAKIAQYDTACRQKTVLHGVIGSAETNEDLGKTFWVIYDDNVTIYIPFDEAFQNPPKDMTDESKKDRWNQTQFLTKSIGATIPFVVTNIEVDHENLQAFCVASRNYGMRKVRRKYFGKDAVYSTEVGTDVDATIIAVGTHSARIAACGMDMKVRNVDLTHRYINDCKEEFLPGQTVRMRIVKVEQGDGELPKLTLSARPLEMEGYVKASQKLKPGSRHAGVVVAVSRTKNSKIVARLFLDGVNVPATCADITPHICQNISSGTKVIFEVGGVKESGYVHGKILSIVAKPKL